MKEIEKKIIEFIRINRVSTTEIADALGKRGAIYGVKAVNFGKHCVGKIRGIVVADGSNFGVHEELRSLCQDEVFLVSTNNFLHDEAVLGDLVTRSAIIYKNAAAVVVVGKVRDYARLRREDYPIWSTGSNPIGAVNEERSPSQRHSQDGGIAVCDDGGVVIIDVDSISNETLTNLQKIERQEDIWYFCLNTLKWETFDIVCKRKYREASELLPIQLRDLPID